MYVQQLPKLAYDLISRDLVDHFYIRLDKRAPGEICEFDPLIPDCVQRYLLSEQGVQTGTALTNLGFKIGDTIRVAPHRITPEHKPIAVKVSDIAFTEILSMTELQEPSDEGLYPDKQGFYYISPAVRIPEKKHYQVLVRLADSWWGEKAIGRNDHLVKVIITPAS